VILLSPVHDPAGQWQHLEPLLASAIKTGSFSSDLVHDELAAGRMQCWSVYGGAAQGLVVTSTANIIGTDIKACWVLYAVGKLNAFGTIAALMASFEAWARSRGCARMRVESPRWNALLRLGYVRDGNILEKVL
jgi:hypothetical protein